MIRLLSVLLLLAVASCGLADDERDEENKYIYLTFYDKAFEEFCLEHYDLNHDGRISRYEAQRVVRMECPDRGIASMSDIRDFVNLQRLDCSGNTLTQLDMSYCPRLERLDCSRNRLAALGVNGLRNLTYLDCRDNRLPRLDLLSNASLAQLDCRNNLLTTLDVASCAVTLRADVRDNADLGAVYYRAGQSVTFNGPTRPVER